MQENAAAKSAWELGPPMTYVQDELQDETVEWQADEAHSVCVEQFTESILRDMLNARTRAVLLFLQASRRSSESTSIL